MATTNTIQNTLNWLTAFIVQRPTTGVGGNASEPALTSANYIMQSILSAPFRWEWNRLFLPAAITTVAGTTDYPVSIPTFGYLEKATLVNATPIGNAAPNYELEVYKVIATDGKQNRPNRIAVLLDDNAGNITFRLFPVPDQAYTINMDIQKAAVTATSLGNLWAPIPDKMAFLYEQGLKATLQGMYNAQLYMSGMELFFRQLVGASTGLSEAEKDIFLADAIRYTKMRSAETIETQQGRQVRA